MGLNPCVSNLLLAAEFRPFSHLHDLFINSRDHHQGRPIFSFLAREFEQTTPSPLRVRIKLVSTDMSTGHQGKDDGARELTMPLGPVTRARAKRLKESLYAYVGYALQRSIREGPNGGEVFGSQPEIIHLSQILGSEPDEA